MERMRKEITKEEIFNRFGENFGSIVTYKDGKEHRYDDPKHINWKAVHKIRIDIPPKKYFNGREMVTRDGVSYLLK